MNPDKIILRNSCRLIGVLLMIGGPVGFLGWGLHLWSNGHFPGFEPFLSALCLGLVAELGGIFLLKAIKAK